jgi:dihydrofolate reductase
MSLDGFIAGPGDSMDWVFESDGPNPAVDDVIRITGAILAGRRSYDVGERDTGKPSGEAFGGAWTGPEFVLTHRPPEQDQSGKVFLSGDIRKAVSTALSAAGGKNLIIIGADAARQCIEHGLIDELFVIIAPIMLGDGVRLYEAAGGRRVDLEPIATERVGQVSNLRFRVRK